MKKVLRGCIVCCRFQGKPFPSPMSPSFRVQEFPPFSYTEMDFAGPLFVKSDENKVWISLYTCCSSRAVHFVVVPNLTAEAFIRCFRRLIARRGIPCRIISDKRKTFMAAKKAISKIIKDSCSRIFIGLSCAVDIKPGKSSLVGKALRKDGGVDKKMFEVVHGAS